MPDAYASIAFTPAVRAEQARFGSADVYAGRLSAEGAEGAELGPREAAFLSARDSVCIASVSETGWLYVQHRGGAPGFLRVIDRQTIGFADYRGNRQYISVGNLRHADRMSILAIDFARRKRLKLCGYARITEDPQIIDLLNGAEGPAAERGIVVRVAAVDLNCAKHIPLRLIEPERDEEISRLREEVARLKRELEGVMEQELDAKAALEPGAGN